MAQPRQPEAAQSTFVGRSAELEHICGSLEARRLVTITGQAGIGKTRLALYAASVSQDRYADGVHVIDLSRANTCGAVITLVGQALGTGSAEHVVRALLDRLGQKRVLLVLDGCERALHACAGLVPVLLQSSRNLHVLTTSRAAPVIDGAIACPTPPLRLPSQQECSVERLRENEAAGLFLERVAAASPEFTLTEPAVPQVVEICRNLEGIPLALELAARWVRDFGLPGVVSVTRDLTYLLHASAACDRRLLRGVVSQHADGALTTREYQVLSLIACGYSNKEIGTELQISDATARIHVEHILNKLNLRSRTEAALWAVHRGYDFAGFAGDV